MKGRVIKTVLIIGVILVVGYFLSKYFESTNEENSVILEKYPIITSNRVIEEYMQLFNDESRANLKLKNTFERKAKYPVSNFEFNSKYIIQVYKLSSSFNYSLREIKENNSEDDGPSVKVWYDQNSQGLVTIMDKTGILDVPSSIYFSLHGDSSSIKIKNDSVADYFSQINSFSIKYKNKDVNQICADISMFHEKPVSFEILFIKKKANLYLLFMSPKGYSGVLRPEMLYNLSHTGRSL